MCIDLPRIDYDKGKKVKKSDFEFVREENRRIAEESKKKKESGQSSYGDKLKGV